MHLRLSVQVDAATTELEMVVSPCKAGSQEGLNGIIDVTHNGVGDEMVVWGEDSDQ